ncbi:MAG: UvrD-helicase domain-containing protein [Tenacibaculum sp.]|nr:UvrD-helicase domain-containing protein [Tenacibaculum sp.]
MQKSSEFKVYNASAGSGKTFTLVKEYLKILLVNDNHKFWDVFRFQKILAITFTNKAAGEMKERVLKNLNDFSNGVKNAIYLEILKETTLDDVTIKNRSEKILHSILQNYSAFSITTIDSFTHKIIKNFAYDLGLSLNFEVEMDADLLLNEAVDVLISKIGTDKDITKLLIDFSLEKTDDDKSWDIAIEFNKFAKILLNEDDVKHFKELSNKSLSHFTDLKNKLYKIQKNIENHSKQIAVEGLEIIENSNLQHNDFYRSMLPNHFVALQKGISSAKFFDDSKLRERIEENTFYAKTKSDDIKTTIEEILPELLSLYAESEKLYQQYTLNKLVLRGLIPLAVLNRINSELNSLKEDNNIRLNAEFNQLISENIKNQPAPFIYERIGQRFMHYFIDEMQDTSVLQWQNLIPLIDNALAQENSSLLLVGDGKQAIYRWRGGKAEQFINLSSLNGGNPFNVDKKLNQLQTNFRSYSEIINFNNNFFQHTANFLQNEDYKKLFVEGNNQQENQKKGGFVSLSFLKKEEDKEEENLKYPKKVLEKINELKSDFSLSDICILVRKKKDGIAVANYLSENGINVVSSETLLLKNSEKVNFLINILQVIQNPLDKDVLFKILYFLYDFLNIQEEKHQFINSLIHKQNEDVFEELKKYGTSFSLYNYHQLPFYEKIENIIRGFNLLQSSDAYVQFFLDVVIEQQRKGTSVLDFLEYWKKKKNNLSIVTSKNPNAVEIMTIHKSKGLEFPVVIFPYDLDIYRQIDPKIWFNDLPDDFNGFKELQIPFSKELNYISDRGAEIYQHQQEELELDNFNLLYVALTRAVEQLHIITEYKISPKGEVNTKYYSGIFIDYLQNIGEWNDEKLEYSFGKQERVSEIKEDKTSSEIQEKFISTPWQQHNIKMLASSSKLWDTEQGKAIDFGNLIHEMLSKVFISNDVCKVVNQYEKQGEFLSEEKEKIETFIYGVVNHPELKEYFSNDNTVYNEKELVTETNSILIPDRLVINDNSVTIIDYKTGKPNKSYHQQLIGYEDVLRAMGFSINKKILVYINEEILIEEI